VKRFGRFCRDNGLTLAFLLLLLGALIGQSISGVSEFNAQQLSNGGQQISWAAYLVSSSFAVDIAENWQSEYLQFALYIVATTWLIQRGSSESKKPDEVGTGSDEEQKVGRYAGPDSPAWARSGGLRAAVYGRSLGAIMTFFFLMSLLAQSIAGRAAFDGQLLDRGQDALSWAGYATSADFWNRTLQNWQSEFLAVASMAAFAIYLRQRGSPESKLVGAPHDATAEDP
jgi:membrane protein implicated in regulation of membrane protease activity